MVIVISTFSPLLKGVGWTYDEYAEVVELVDTPS